MPCELVLIRGLPGSGKTTHALKYASIGYAHHEADHYFERYGVYDFDPSKIQKAHADCLAKTVASLRAGINTVVANTFCQQWEAQPYLDAAKALGIPVWVVECQDSFGSIHNVPAKVIDKMRKRWETIEV